VQNRAAAMGGRAPPKRPAVRREWCGVNSPGGLFQEAPPTTASTFGAPADRITLAR
jgi:hypothetical protein